MELLVDLEHRSLDLVSEEHRISINDSFAQNDASLRLIMLSFWQAYGRIPRGSSITIEIFVVEGAGLDLGRGVLDAVFTGDILSGA